MVYGVLKIDLLFEKITVFQQLKIDIYGKTRISTNNMVCIKVVKFINLMKIKCQISFR